MKVEIWSDIACPWCAVGRSRLQRALDGFPHPVEVVWRSFELDPHARPVAEGSYVERLGAKYGRSPAQAQEMVDSMTATGAAEGLAFDFGRLRGGSTFDAHRLLHLAREHGLQDALKGRLQQAYLGEGVAMSDHEALARLAGEVGLPVDEARDVLASGRYGDAVRADEAQAAAFGISAVPFFVLDDRYGVSGAQPAEVLRSALQQAWDAQDRAEV